MTELLRFGVEGGIARLPLERTPASVKLMEDYANAARAAGLGTGEAPLIGGGSDASSGCSCRLGSDSGSGSGKTSALLLAVALLLRRRRTGRLKDG